MNISKYKNFISSHDHEEVTFEYFEIDYFKSKESYNQLLLSKSFYERFDTFEYLLIYHLDAFVFRDELHKWCKKGYDYIGAPWLSGLTEANEHSSFLGVGNGGFSLRKILSHIRVLESTPSLNQSMDISTFKSHNSQQLRKYTKTSLINASHIDRKRIEQCNNEDFFWGIHTPDIFEWFYVPKPEEAMYFSFETVPRKLFKLTNQQLPFGCHGWFLFDFVFWKPHIEGFGFQLPSRALFQNHDRNKYD